jgi:hypothetical protein
MALWNRNKEPVTRERVISDVRQLLDNYDLVEVARDYLVVADKPRKLAANGQVSTELGRTATRYRYMGTTEYNPKWMGLQGLRVADEMRRSDGQIRAILRLVKTPVLAGSWYIEPASDSPQDQEIAKFVWDNLTKWMSTSWPQLLTEALAHLDFGWYCFEKVYDFRTVNGQNRVIWKKFAPRHPMDAGDWVFDDEGGPNGIYFPAAGDGGEEVYIPIDKLLLFINDKEGGNWEGVSILRPAYKHWFYKDNLYKIDAIQKERHGVGVPLIKLPPNYSSDDKKVANELGSNLRTNEKAHVVLPPGWDIMMLRLEGSPVDVMKSIEHHDTLIARTILAPLLSSDSEDTFLKATRYIAYQVRDVFNRYAIPQLVDFNWDVDEYPELRVRRIGETVDWRTISFAIRNLVGANVIIPDERMESYFREELDLPRKDKGTERLELPTPQGARVGLPRQSRATNMRIDSGSTGRVGQDRSGG